MLTSTLLNLLKLCIVSASGGVPPRFAIVKDLGSRIEVSSTLQLLFDSVCLSQMLVVLTLDTGLLSWTPAYL